MEKFVIDIFWVTSIQEPHLTLCTPRVPVTLRQMHGTETFPGHVPTGFAQRIGGWTIGLKSLWKLKVRLG